MSGLFVVVRIGYIHFKCTCNVILGEFSFWHLFSNVSVWSSMILFV